MAKKNAPKQQVARTKKSAPTKAGSKSKALALIAVLAVVVIVAGVVGFAVLKPSSTNSGGSSAFTPSETSIVKAVTEIPASVYNKVGVTSSVARVTPPASVKGQPPLLFAGPHGVKAPGVFYYGAEWCPYCAAERWAVVAALSRFGTWSNLGATHSSLTDVYPGTPSFTFAKASLANAPLELRAIERYSNVQLASGGYQNLMVPTRQEEELFTKYDTWTYIPGMSASQNGSIPFMDIGNKYLVSGSSYSPSILTGLTASEIAHGLTDTTNPATQAIVATANYLTAAVCQITKGNPGSVCDSAGVKAANVVMGIK